MNLRAKLTRAITKSRSTHTEEAPSDFQINLVTGSYSNETCSLMLAAEGTEHEEITLLLASSYISSDQIMHAFIRAVPEHDEYGQILMLEYFKALDQYRNVTLHGLDYEGSQLETLMGTANEYLTHTAAPCLPIATDTERRIIALVSAHPSMIETLADHIGARSLDNELLDSFYNTPSPSLSNGIL